MKAALALGLLVVLPACAATRTGPTRAQQGYLKTHPLSPDEERRLVAREVQRGDTIDRVRVTWDGCDFERASSEGELAIWRVHVPIDQPPIRVVTDKLEDIPAGGSAMLTFKNDRLDRVMILE